MDRRIEGSGLKVHPACQCRAPTFTVQIPVTVCRSNGPLCAYHETARFPARLLWTPLSDRGPKQARTADSGPPGLYLMLAPTDI